MCGPHHKQTEWLGIFGQFCLELDSMPKQQYVQAAENLQLATALLPRHWAQHGKVWLASVKVQAEDMLIAATRGASSLS